MKIPKRPICSVHGVLKSLLHLSKGYIASYSDWKAFISLFLSCFFFFGFNEKIFRVILYYYFIKVTNIFNMLNSY